MTILSFPIFLLDFSEPIPFPIPKNTVFTEDQLISRKAKYHNSPVSSKNLEACCSFLKSNSPDLWFVRTIVHCCDKKRKTKILTYLSHWSSLGDSGPQSISQKEVCVHCLELLNEWQDRNLTHTYMCTYILPLPCFTFRCVFSTVFPI